MASNCDTSFNIQVRIHPPGKTQVTRVEHYDETVEILKNTISEQLNVNPSNIRLVLCGKIMDNDKTLRHYNVTNYACIHAIIDELEYVTLCISDTTSSCYEQSSNTTNSVISVDTLTRENTRLKLLLDEAGIDY